MKRAIPSGPAIIAASGRSAMVPPPGSLAVDARRAPSWRKIIADQEPSAVSQDLLDPATFAAGHPIALYNSLRETSPVHWNPEPGGPGFWAVTRYADVYAVDHDFQTFSSDPTIMIQDPLGETEGMLGEAKMMLMMDPPQHTGFRKLIRAEFTRPAAADARPTHARPGAADRRRGDREGRVRFRRPRSPARCRPTSSPS